MIHGTSDNSATVHRLCKLKTCAYIRNTPQWSILCTHTLLIEHTARTFDWDRVESCETHTKVNLSYSTANSSIIILYN